MSKVTAELNTVANTAGIDKANKAIDSLIRKINGMSSKDLPSFNKMAKDAEKVTKTIDQMNAKVASMASLNSSAFNINARGLNEALKTVDRLNDRVERLASKFERLSSSSKSLTSASAAAAVVNSGGNKPPTAVNTSGGNGGKMGPIAFLASKGQSVAAYNIAHVVGVQAPLSAMGAMSDASRERFLQKISGINPADIDRINKSAASATKEFSFLNLAQSQELARETYMNVPNAKIFEPVYDNIMRLAQFQRIFNKDSEAAKRETQRLIKAGDIMGKFETTADAERFVNGVIAARVVSGKDLTSGDFLNYAKYAKQAKFGVSDLFTYAIMPSIADEMGGGRAGTVLSSFFDNVSGRGSKESKKYKQSIGMADKDGRDFNYRMALENPQDYIWGPLTDMLRKRGFVDGNNIVTDKAGLAAELSRMYNNKQVQDFVSSLIYKRAEYEGKVAKYGQVNVSRAAAISMGQEDVGSAYSGLKAAGQNVAISVEKYTTPIVNSIYNAITSGLNYIAENPKGTATAGGLAFGAYAAKKTFDFVSDNPLVVSAGALTGSAVSLKGAAAALTAAAGLQKIIPGGVGATAATAAKQAGVQAATNTAAAVAGATLAQKVIVGGGAIAVGAMVADVVRDMSETNAAENIRARKRSLSSQDLGLNYDNPTDRITIEKLARDATELFRRDPEAARGQAFMSISDAARSIEQSGVVAGESVKAGGQGAADTLSSNASAIGSAIGSSAAAAINSQTNVNVNVNGVPTGALKTGTEGPKQ